MKVPGETDIEVASVTLEAADGSDLTPSKAELLDGLGMRAPSLVLPGRYYSEFREAEDRRRITAYWENFGFFDVEVAEPELEFDDAEKSVEIRWLIEENTRYRVAAVHLENAPQRYEDALRAKIPFDEGTRDIDVEAFRKARIDMHDHLRDEGFGHATVYSRTFVDRQDEALHWYYYVDAGPKTRVGDVAVEGNERVPDELIQARVGLERGDPYAYGDKEKREFDLLDAGAFASTFIATTADTTFIPPGDDPDTGGTLRPGQVDEDGNFVPRELPEEVDLEINVVEAPSRQIRVRGGVEADPWRLDTALSSRATLRDVFGPLHHMVLEGRLGYGWHWRGDTGEPAGVFGDALVRYIRPMLLSRLTDFRLTGRLRDELYPGFHMREVTAGPGIRSTVASGVFVDTDVVFRWGQQAGFGPFDEATREEHDLADDDIYVGGELQASLVWEGRDNPVEALRGHLVALRTSLSPGAPGGAERWNRYLTLRPEARYFHPLTESTSIALRGDLGWALAGDDRGIPLGPRFFGGGSRGMRGFGRQRMSPYVPPCDTAGGLSCEGQPVGGLSIAETSIEARFLPEHEPYGAVGFFDMGGVGTGANPFERGMSAAAGLGLRLRLWYLPASIDAGYRIFRENEVQTPADNPFQVFFRIGEAF